MTVDPMISKIEGFLTDCDEPGVIGIIFPNDTCGDPGYTSAEVIDMIRWMRDRPCPWVRGNTTKHCALADADVDRVERQLRAEQTELLNDLAAAKSAAGALSIKLRELRDEGCQDGHLCARCGNTFDPAPELEHLDRTELTERVQTLEAERDRLRDSVEWLRGERQAHAVASERVRTLEAAAGAVVDEWGTNDWISSTLEAALNDLRALLDPDGAVTDD